jgi:heme/copper-type cytochrome/quinol oxidase subunit 1
VLSAATVRWGKELCHALAMNWLHPLGRAERIVLVVALGVALEALGSFLGGVGAAAGWVAYAPLSQATQIGPGGLHRWVRLFIWLVLTTVWAITSIAILRAPTSE